MEGNKKTWVKLIWMFLSTFHIARISFRKLLLLLGILSLSLKQSKSFIPERLQMGLEIEPGKYYPWIPDQQAVAA